ncbi:MAG: hypothetical protein QG637_351 [Chloroflexota bacterium]|nr:hypothetical protein [Chloroflexota bacterium]
MISSHEIERLQTASALQETVFRSHFPVIGPLIAWFRAAWNNISTKWYVRPLIAQQNEFNALVVNQLRRMAEQLHGQEAQLVEVDRRIGEIDHRLAEGAAQSAQLRSWIADRTGSQETRIHDLAAWLIAQDREQSESIHDLAELRVQLVQLRKQLTQVHQPPTPSAEDDGGVGVNR